MIPPKLAEIELWAWLGEDELGSGEVGLKQADVPAGRVPMVAVRRDRMEEHWPQAELMSQHFGKRIYLCRFTMAEIVRHTKFGE